MSLSGAATALPLAPPTLVHHALLERQPGNPVAALIHSATDHAPTLEQTPCPKVKPNDFRGLRDFARPLPAAHSRHCRRTTAPRPDAAVSAIAPGGLQKWRGARGASPQPGRLYCPFRWKPTSACVKPRSRGHPLANDGRACVPCGVKVRKSRKTPGLPSQDLAVFETPGRRMRTRIFRNPAIQAARATPDPRTNASIPVTGRTVRPARPRIRWAHVAGQPESRTGGNVMQSLTAGCFLLRCYDPPVSSRRCAVNPQNHRNPNEFHRAIRDFVKPAGKFGNLWASGLEVRQRGRKGRMS